MVNVSIVKCYLLSHLLFGLFLGGGEGGGGRGGLSPFESNLFMFGWNPVDSDKFKGQRF